MGRSKLLVVAVITIMVMAFLAFDAFQYLNLEFFKAQHEAFVTYYHICPVDFEVTWL